MAKQIHPKPEAQIPAEILQMILSLLPWRKGQTVWLPFKQDSKVFGFLEPKIKVLAQFEAPKQKPDHLLALWPLKSDPAIWQQTGLETPFPETLAQYPEWICFWQLIHQVKHSAALILPVGFLFRSDSVLIHLRQQLLQDRLIQSVIALPADIFPHTKIRLALVILKPTEPVDEIHFFDADKAYLDPTHAPSADLPNTLTGWEQLLIDFKQHRRGSRSLQAKDMLKVPPFLMMPDAQLDRYLGTRTLMDLAKIWRGQRVPVENPSDGVIFNEIGPSDFPALGELHHSDRIQVRSTLGEKYALQAGDLLVPVKGRSTQVALVARNLPAETYWRAHQMLAIVRFKDPRLIVPVFLYLRSEAGQSRLQSLMVGIVNAQISLRELQELTIPDAVFEQADALHELFENECQWVTQLEQHQQDLKRYLEQLPWGRQGE